MSNETLTRRRLLTEAAVRSAAIVVFGDIAFQSGRDGISVYQERANVVNMAYPKKYSPEDEAAAIEQKKEALSRIAQAQRAQTPAAAFRFTDKEYNGIEIAEYQEARAGIYEDYTKIYNNQIVRDIIGTVVGGFAAFLTTVSLDNLRLRYKRQQKVSKQPTPSTI